MRDTVGLTLLDMGKRPEDVTADDYDAAIARLQKGVDNKQIRRFTGNDYTDDLDKGDIAACVAWAGDLVQLQTDNPDIEYAIPERRLHDVHRQPAGPEQGPAQAERRTAHRLLLRARRSPPSSPAYINYVCPVDGVRDELAKIDKELGGQPADPAGQGDGRQVPLLPLP